MKCEEMIKEIYFVAGALEGLSCTQGQPMTEASAFILGDCVDRLELVGAQLLANSGTKLEIKGMPSEEQMIKYLSEKKVNVYAGRPTEVFGRVYPAQEDASDQ